LINIITEIDLSIRVGIHVGHNIDGFFHKINTGHSTWTRWWWKTWTLTVEITEIFGAVIGSPFIFGHD
jgi:hypothetical protein